MKTRIGLVTMLGYALTLPVVTMKIAAQAGGGRRAQTGVRITLGHSSTE
jgi:hypothetical protein